MVILWEISQDTKQYHALYIPLCSVEFDVLSPVDSDPILYLYELYLFSIS